MPKFTHFRAESSKLKKYFSQHKRLILIVSSLRQGVLNESPDSCVVSIMHNYLSIQIPQCTDSAQANNPGIEVDSAALRCHSLNLPTQIKNIVGKLKSAAV